MALSINVAILGGNVGQTPELKYTKKGTAVTELSLATSDPMDTNNTLWHNVTLWGKNAENVCRFIKKGRGVIVEGYNRPEKYTAKDGTSRKKHTVSVYKVTFTSNSKDHAQETEEVQKEDYTVNLDTTFTENDIPF